MSKADYAAFIGRFQPVHKAHVKIIKNALENEAEKLIIVVGSYRTTRTLRNPWTAEERVSMIREAIGDPNLLNRIIFVTVRDYLYSTLTWLTGVQNAISGCLENPGKTVKLIGHFKDDTSFYLKLFPQWELVQEPNYFGANSSDVREELFLRGEVSHNILHESTAKTLKKFTERPLYASLRREAEFLDNYKKQWAASPYPPTFMTTDAVVVQAGHILLVERKLNPGKGLLALPGGFLKPNKNCFESCLDELKEETKIVYPKESLKAQLKSSKVFDHPSRDPRGRFITQAFYFKIDQLGPLPHVEGGDDAAKAFWMPISDLPFHEDRFYSDHIHIINYFLHGN